MKQDSYALFSTNGTIMKHSPEENINPKQDFINLVRVFGPFKNYIPSPKKDNIVNNLDDSIPEQEISYDESGQPLPPVENTTGIADSLSGGVGAMILGPIIGHMLGNAINLNAAATQHLTSLVEKGIHIGLDAVEISDSMVSKPSQQINNISDQNVRSLLINNRGNITNLPDLNQNIKIFNASKDQSTNSLNMTAQQKFEARHKVFGKK